MAASGRSRGLVAGVVMAVLAGGGLGAQEPPEVTKEQFDAWMTELSNWGRWGDDDQLGALNLITPAKRVEAARLVQTGRTASMARPIEMQVLDDPDAASANRRPVLMGSVRSVFDIDTGNGYFWGTLRDRVPRTAALAPRRALPRGLRGQGLQRPHLRGDRHGGRRLHRDGHHQRPGRPRDARRPHRHAGQGGDARRHRGVGGRDRHHDLVRGRPVPAHGPGRRPAGRLPSVADPVLQGARHRAARLRRAPGGRHRRGRADPDPRLHARRPRRAPVRQPRPRGPGPDGERARPLGVPLHGVAARRAQRGRGRP